MISRRGFIAASAAIAMSRGGFATPQAAKASIAITLDLEMARNFPTWETTHWDYEKGNLNGETKAYALEAARRVKAAGGVIHFFLVGRALEQENVDWLKQLIAEGHQIGNHTYDHVYVRAKTPAEIQYRFARAPWLIEGREPLDVIRENIKLCNDAIKSRLGIEPAGFRTPGGFADGLSDRADVRKMLMDLGFKWISSKYPAHANSDAGKQPSPEVMADIVERQQEAQPFKYPDGLIEIPMSPISDIGAFRNGRWKLDAFLQAIEMSMNWCIERGAVFDFLAHPAVLYPMDRDFKAIELICRLTREAGERAQTVDLNAIAQTV